MSRDPGLAAADVIHAYWRLVSLKINEVEATYAPPEHRVSWTWTGTVKFREPDEGDEQVWFEVDGDNGDTMWVAVVNGEVFWD